MIDLAKFSVEQLKSLRTEIAGELAKRAGEYIDLRYEEAPQGGAMFYDRPAIGGDRNRDLWFPTLEAANAHLVGLSSGLPVSVREDGSMYCDYTTQGHSQSDMETRLVVTPRTRQIEFASGCLYQPNAVELSTGVIVFDACGECELCGNHGLKGSACKDGVMIRKATDYEVAQQTRVINAPEHQRGTEPTSTP